MTNKPKARRLPMDQQKYKAQRARAMFTIVPVARKGRVFKGVYLAGTQTLVATISGRRGAWDYKMNGSMRDSDGKIHSGFKSVNDVCLALMERV